MVLTSVPVSDILSMVLQTGMKMRVNVNVNVRRMSIAKVMKAIFRLGIKLRKLVSVYSTIGRVLF